MRVGHWRRGSQRPQEMKRLDKGAPESQVSAHTSAHHPLAWAGPRGLHTRSSLVDETQGSLGIQCWGQSSMA